MPFVCLENNQEINLALVVENKSMWADDCGLIGVFIVYDGVRLIQLPVWRLNCVAKKYLADKK